MVTWYIEHDFCNVLLRATTICYHAAHANLTVLPESLLFHRLCHLLITQTEC